MEIRRFIDDNKELIKELIKFSMVGVINFLLEFAIFLLLTRVFNLNEVVAKAISYPCGVVNSYILNSKYTFKVKMKFNSMTFVKFVLINVISYGVSLLAIYIFTQMYFMADWLANIIATAFAFFVNFAGNKFIVFSKKNSEGKR